MKCATGRDYQFVDWYRSFTSFHYNHPKLSPEPPYWLTVLFPSDITVYGWPDVTCTKLKDQFISSAEDWIEIVW